jgi:integrase
MEQEGRASPDRNGRVWLDRGIFKKRHARRDIWWFYIRYGTNNGRRRVEKAGTTRAQADRLLKKRLGEVASGTYVDPRTVDGDAGPTFQEFVERFFREHPGRRRSDHYRTALKAPLAYFEDRPIREIGRADLDRFRIHLLTSISPAIGRPLSATSVLKILRSLGRVFKMAVRWGVVEHDPAAALEKPSLPTPKTRYLTAAEFQTLESSAAPWLRPILRMAVCTGMRLKEVVGLRWDNVDRQAGILYVSEDSKTGSRPIPINQTVREVLDTQVRHLRTPWVFLSDSGSDYTSPGARNCISKATSDAMRAAGISDASFHTLRHTAAAWMVQGGVSLYEVQKILGHSTPVMTQRYAHLAPDHLRGAMKALDLALRSMATGLATGTGNATSSPTSGRVTI